MPVISYINNNYKSFGAYGLIENTCYSTVFDCGFVVSCMLTLIFRILVFLFRK